MTTSTVYFCHNLKLPLTSLFSVAWRNQPSFFVRFSCKRKRFCGFVANAENDNNEYSRNWKTSWWGRFFFEDDGNWLGLKDDDMVEEVGDMLSDSEEDEELLGGGKFEAWKRRAEAIIELREAQEDMRNEESRRWEDWIVVADGDDNKLGSANDWDDGGGGGGLGLGVGVGEENGNGLVRSVRDLVIGRGDEDVLYEDRVFRYASFNSASYFRISVDLLVYTLSLVHLIVNNPSIKFTYDKGQSCSYIFLGSQAKFLAALLIVPLALDFVVHDFVLMPFLDRYVKTVPLAAEILDVRRNQKLEMVKQLQVEKARFRFEVEIGKSPPLSDEELWWELRSKA
ncbi:hypothetical protein Goklo_009811 [Gossypium klotzschianum]|nr:hypothetical protein [Gossypium klotzschianum]